MTIGDNDVIRVTAVLKRAAVNDVQNVYYASLVTAGGASQADLRDDLADWMETIYDGLVGVLVDSITFDEIQLFNMTDGTPEPSLTWPSLTAGAETDDQVADGVSGLVLGRTGASKVVGKKYFGLFTQIHMPEGLWDSTLITQLAAAGASWVAPFTGASGATWDPGVWQRATLGFEVFVESVTSNVPAYQRRRKRGVGS